MVKLNAVKIFKSTIEYCRLVIYRLNKTLAVLGVLDEDVVDEDDDEGWGWDEDEGRGQAGSSVTLLRAVPSTPVDPLRVQGHTLGGVHRLTETYNVYKYKKCT